MKNFLLIANLDKPEAVTLSLEVERRLRERECNAVWKITPEPEGILVVGGDGTLLKAARELRNRELPFLGINAGTLGYLAEVDRDHVEEALDLLTGPNVVIGERMMLYGQVNRDGVVIHRDVALNDIVVKGRDFSMMHFKVYVDGEYLTTYQADGMVVSTPTGSTAYNLSAGGPVVDPLASLKVLTPVSPHTLILRSIVLGADSVVEMEVIEHPNRRGVNGSVTFDGSPGMSLQAGDRIFIRRANRTTRIVRFSNASFLETLRAKMADR